MKLTCKAGVNIGSDHCAVMKLRLFDKRFNLLGVVVRVWLYY